jgi:hypothetical protein
MIHPPSANGRPKRYYFDYKDEQGRTLFRVVRVEPGRDGSNKDIFQQRPDGKGWKNGIEGIRRVPYRLPDLLRQDTQRPIFVVEGEKKVDQLWDIDAAATCNQGGAGKWLPEFAEHFKGRHVVILPDNDDAGREHANQVAENLLSVAASVRILELPELPPKGDVVDWLQVEGNDKTKLLDLMQAAPVLEKPATPAYKPFPTHLLPKPLSTYVSEAAASLKVDAGYVVLSVLATVAAAIGSTHWLRLKKGWVEPPIIWGVTIVESGTLKSVAHRQGVYYALRKQELYKAAGEKEIEKWESDMEAYKDAKRAKTAATHPGPKPTVRRIVTRDITLERLIELLEENPKGLLVERDELRAWFAGFTRYRAGQSSDLPNWLEMSSGGTLIVDRKGTDPTAKRTVYVRHACPSVCGTIQPRIMAKSLSPDYRESGLAARLLMVMPPVSITLWSDLEIDDATEAGYEGLLNQLYDLKFKDESSPTDRRHILQLDPVAKRSWVDFYNQWQERKQNADGDLRAALCKIEGYAARLSLIHYIVKQINAGDPIGDEVDAESIEAGCQLAEWFADEGERVYAILGQMTTGEQSGLVEWIAAREGKITARKLQESRRGSYPTSEAARAALDALVAEGRGVWEDQPAGPRGGQPTKVFRLKTTCHTTTQPQNHSTPRAQEVA